MELQNQIEYQLFRGLLGLMRGCSPAAVADMLGLLGVWTGQVLRYRRRVVRRQLTMVFPEMSETRQIQLAHQIYDHLGRTVGEAFGQGLLALADRVGAETDWSPLDAALASGRGVIAATGHIGNFELGGVVLANRYPLLDVIKPQRNPLFDGIINEIRAQRGILTVPMDRSGPVVVRHLRKGGLVTLLLDQDAGPDGLEVDFLGHPASTWPGAARLSIRTGCPVVPLAILRQTDGTHRLLISEPLFPEDLGDTAADVQIYLQRISHGVEGFIRDHPAQWFWVHRRWKGGSAWKVHENV